MKKWVLVGWLALFSAGSAGCAALLFSAGAVGGYAVSRDSVVDYLEQSPDVVYGESLAVAREMGEVTLEAPKQGVIGARIGDTQVKITVRALTERTVQLRIRARSRLMMPRVAVAQELYGRIKERL